MSGLDVPIKQMKRQTSIEEIAKDSTSQQDEKKLPKPQETDHQHLAPEKLNDGIPVFVSTLAASGCNQQMILKLVRANHNKQI